MSGYLGLHKNLTTSIFMWTQMHDQKGTRGNETVGAVTGRLYERRIQGVCRGKSNGNNRC